MSRLAYICADPGVPVFGSKGCSVHVQEMVRAVARRGAQIDLFAVNRGGEPPDDFGRVRCHALPAAPKGDLAFREQHYLAANAPLQEILRREGPFDFIYERYSLWSFAALEYARAQSIPALLEVNAPLIEEQSQYRGLVDRTGATAATRRAFAAASSILAVSNGLTTYLAQFHETRGKVHIVPNAVDSARFPATTPASLPATDGIFTVGFVGSMKPWHGLADLLAAFSRLEHEKLGNRLLLVGDGPARVELQALTRSLELAHAVQFTGAVLPAEVPGLLASMDVAVAPYEDRPNFYFSPLKVYEYMAASLPVVANAVGQLNELIEPEVTGLLVPPADPAALTRALLRLRSEPALRARLGQAARAKVLSRHTWDANATRVLTLAGCNPRENIERSVARMDHVPT